MVPRRWSRLTFVDPTTLSRPYLCFRVKCLDNCWKYSLSCQNSPILLVYEQKLKLDPMLPERALGFTSIISPSSQPFSLIIVNVKTYSLKIQIFSEVKQRKRNTIGKNRNTIDSIFEIHYFKILLNVLSHKSFNTNIVTCIYAINGNRYNYRAFWKCTCQ